MTSPSKLKTYNFKYSKVDGFKTTQVHGVYGGLTIRGQINMNFYVDTIEPIEATTAPISDNNKLGKEVLSPNSPLSSMREVHFGINIDILLAKELVAWLDAHIKNHEQVHKTLVEGDEKK